MPPKVVGPNEKQTAVVNTFVSAFVLKYDAKFSWNRCVRSGLRWDLSRCSSIPRRVMPIHVEAGPLGRPSRQPRILSIWPQTGVPASDNVGGRWGLTPHGAA